MRPFALAPWVAAVGLGSALAAPLFKLVDRDGRITFTDSPPKHFDGQVIRLESMAVPSVPLAPPPKPSPLTEAAPLKPTSETFSERRRRDQAQRLAQLERAREAAEAARRAVEAGTRPAPEEMQVIQRRFPPLRPGQPAPYPNCAQRKDPGSGAAVLICPAQVPGQAYHERQRRLNAALTAAEESLAEAEREYRRSLD